MEYNPFNPPKANVGGAPNEPSIYPVIALTFIQVVCFSIYFLYQFELVRIGALRPLVLFSAAISTLLLIVGIIMLAWKRKGKTIFLVSGLGFIIAFALVWEIPISPLIKYSANTLGVVVSIYSWWITRCYQIESLKFKNIFQAGQ